MVLILTEQLLRTRSLIPADQDVSRIKELVLNGIRHPDKEKVTHLGRSLKNFQNLRKLDLSRNAIESLEGLEHNTKLISLNLYPFRNHFAMSASRSIISWFYRTFRLRKATVGFELILL
jgi:hypothetical protein